MKKRILTLVLILSMLFVMGIGTFTVSAAENEGTVTPRFTNCDQCNFIFRVLDPGEAHISVTYYARPDVFTEAKLTVKIQKKVLGVFWQTLTINGSSDEWWAYSYATIDQFYKYFPVDGKGTYRAIFCVEISGTSGVVDVIESTIEYKYT